MPLPPEDATTIEDKEPDFKFSYVECLMYALHQLGRRTPSLLTDELNADRLKDFRLRSVDSVVTSFTTRSLIRWHIPLRYRSRLWVFSVVFAEWMCLQNLISDLPPAYSLHVFDIC